PLVCSTRIVSSSERLEDRSKCVCRTRRCGGIEHGPISRAEPLVGVPHVSPDLRECLVGFRQAWRHCDGLVDMTSAEIANAQTPVFRCYSKVIRCGRRCRLPDKSCRKSSIAFFDCQANTLRWPADPEFRR